MSRRTKGVSYLYMIHNRGQNFSHDLATTTVIMIQNHFYALIYEGGCLPGFLLPMNGLYTPTITYVQRPHIRKLTQKPFVDVSFPPSVLPYPP